MAIGLLVVTLTQVVQADTRVNYLLHCGGCHRVDGTGLPPEVPTLVGTIGPLAGSPKGRDYLARVPGAAQAPITDAELAAVLNWVLTAFNAETLPVDFKPLDLAEIRRSRPQALADPTRLRNEIWQDAELDKKPADSLD